MNNFVWCYDQKRSIWPWPFQRQFDTKRSDPSFLSSFWTFFCIQLCIFYAIKSNFLSSVFLELSRIIPYFLWFSREVFIPDNELKHLKVFPHWSFMRNLIPTRYVCYLQHKNLKSKRKEVQESLALAFCWRKSSNYDSRVSLKFEWEKGKK